MTNNIPTNKEVQNMSFEQLEELLKEDLPGGIKLTIIRHLSDMYANTMDMVKFKQKCNELITFAQKSHIKSDMFIAYNLTGSYYLKVHEPQKAMDYFQKALAIANETGNTNNKIAVSNSIAALFLDLGKREQAVQMFKECYDQEKQINGGGEARFAWNIGLTYTIMEQYPNALKYLEIAEEEANIEPDSINKNLICNIHFTRAETYYAMHDTASAIKCIELCREQCLQQNVLSFYGLTFALEGNIMLDKEEYKKALESYNKCLEIHNTNGIELPFKGLHEKLMETYEAIGDLANALEQAKLIMELQKRSTEKAIQDKALSLELELEKERQERATEKRIAEARLNMMTKVANDIAHEVQNPLQFVNNFSAINVDLVSELNDYLEDKDMEGVKLIGKDIIENSHKVKDHGVRIASIVDHLLDQTRKAQAGELNIVYLSEPNTQ